MAGISDVTMRSVEYALDGLKARLDVHSNNIANVNTPRFRGARVEFEGALRDAMRDGGKLDRIGGPQVRNGVGLPDAQGNTVNLEDELTTIMKTNLAQQAMINAYNFKAGVMRAAITGR